MQFEISKGKVESCLKVVLYGPEGIGKSTFASHFPHPLYIDTEGSTKQLDVERMPTPTSWTMLREEVNYVKANKGICGTLVIDTADWAEAQCIQYICAQAKVNGIEGFGYGKGYTYLAEEFGKMLNDLSDIVDGGTNVLLLAHAYIRKFEQPDELGAYDRWELKLGKKTAPMVKEWSDMLLFANYKTMVVNVDDHGAVKGKNKAQGGRRVMYTSHNPSWDAKNRFGLADEVAFEYESISKFIHTGSAPEKKEEDSLIVPPSERVVPKEDTNFDIEHLNNDIHLTPQQLAEIKPLPNKLGDLMIADQVSCLEIRKAVSDKGYYPLNTPIENYDPTFVNGVIIGAWPQILEVIKKNRELPF